MIKTLSNIFKQDKEKFVIPRSVQQVIPIETIWSDGIFKIGRNKFALTYKFTDNNYFFKILLNSIRNIRLDLASFLIFGICSPSADIKTVDKATSDILNRGSMVLRMNWGNMLVI